MERGARACRTATTWSIGSTAARSSSTSSGAPIGSNASRRASSPRGPNTYAAHRRRNARARWRFTDHGDHGSAYRNINASGCCHDRDAHRRGSVGDDVPAVLRLGRVVHDHRRVHDAATAWGRSRIWPYTVNPIAAIAAPFFLGLVADRTSPLRRCSGCCICSAALCCSPRRDVGERSTLFIVLLLLYNLCYMPTLGARELARLPPHRATRRSSFRGSASGARSAGSSRGCSSASCSALVTAGALAGADGAAALHGGVASLAARACTASRCRTRRPARAGERVSAGASSASTRSSSSAAGRSTSSSSARSCICIPLAAYYNFTQLYPRAAGVAEHRRDADARADVGDRCSCSLMPLLLRAAGREVDAASSGWPRGCCATCCSRSRRPSAVFWMIVAGHPAARHLLRLLLRDRPDLRGQEVDAGDPQAGAGLLRARHVRRRDADRRAGRRKRLQPLPRRRRRAARSLEQWGSFWYLPAGFGAVLVLFASSSRSATGQPSRRDGAVRGAGPRLTRPARTARRMIDAPDISRRDFRRPSVAKARRCVHHRPAPRALAAATSAPSDTLNIACVGVGGKGRSDGGGAWRARTSYALCDVDDRAWPRQSFKPAFRRRSSYTRLATSCSRRGAKDIDAVTVTTPDHTHARPPWRRCKAGQARLLREAAHATSIHEARARRPSARPRQKVATQMGNQGHSSDGTRRSRRADPRRAPSGRSREVHVWTNRPIWPQGIDRPPEPHAGPRAPRLGPLARPGAERPYHRRLPPVQVARLVGLRHRRARRHGAATSSTLPSGRSTSATRSRSRPRALRLTTRDGPRRGRSSATSSRPRGDLPAGEADLVRRRQAAPGGAVRRPSARRGTTAACSSATRAGCWPHDGRRAGGATCCCPSASSPTSRGPSRRCPGRPAITTSGSRRARAARGRLQFSGARRAAHAMVLLGNFAVRAGKPIDVDPATGNLKTTGIPEHYWKPEYRKGWTL